MHTQKKSNSAQPMLFSFSFIGTSHAMDSILFNNSYGKWMEETTGNVFSARQYHLTSMVHSCMLGPLSAHTIRMSSHASNTSHRNTRQLIILPYKQPLRPISNPIPSLP